MSALPVRLSLAAVVSLVASTVVAVAPLPALGSASAKPRPVEATTKQVPLAPAPGVRAGTERTSEVLPVDHVAVVGATWAGGHDAHDAVEVRTRVDGSWQAWETLATEDEHGPDPGSAEDAAAGARRGGTEAYVAVGDAVQVRARSTDADLPQQLEVTLVDPGSAPADATVGVAQPGAAAAATVRPTIHTRAEWGADESIRGSGPYYGQVQVGFIHHTVSSNSYSPSDVPAIMRGIYAFHVNGRGWSDIGYNVLVDRFGRAWEGRYGGVDKAVIGAQAGGYNSGSMGVSVIGDFSTVSPPSVVLKSLASIFAWRFSAAGIPAYGTARVNDKTFNRISGHRDANDTECPGDRLYALIPSIRASVAHRMGTLARTGVSRDLDGNGSPDLVSLESTTAGDRVARVHLSAATNPLSNPSAIGGSWNTVENASLSPDMTGDGHPDVVAVHTSSGALRVYPGTGSGGVRYPVISGSGWARMRDVIPAGDLDGDGRADLLGVGSTGLLAFYAGRGDGRVAPGKVTGSGFTRYRSMSSTGDRTGDRIPDVLAVRVSDGALVVLPGNRNGSLGAAVRVSGGWGILDPVVSAGDLDGDGTPDLLGRLGTGEMRTYYFDRSGSPSRWNTWGRGWNAMAQLSSGVDFDGDGTVDLLGVLTTVDKGTLRLYPGTGGRDEERTVDVALPRTTTMVGVAGDIDGDGHADLVAKAGDGIVALRGLGGARFAAPRVVAASGWGVMPKVSVGTDISYDGVPDLLATSSRGLILRYAFNRDFTLQRPLELEQSWSSYPSFTGVGAMNVDANGDVLVLDGSGSLRLFRGAGDTPLLDSVVIRSGQTDLTSVVGVGDWNGDGELDVVGRARDGRLWLYAGRGGGALWGGRQPLTGTSSYLHRLTRKYTEREGSTDDEEPRPAGRCRRGPGRAVLRGRRAGVARESRVAARPARGVRRPRGTRLRSRHRHVPVGRVRRGHQGALPRADPRVLLPGDRVRHADLLGGPGAAHHRPELCPDRRGRLGEARPGPRRRVDRGPRDLHAPGTGDAVAAPPRRRGSHPPVVLRRQLAHRRSYRQVHSTLGFQGPGGETRILRTSSTARAYPGLVLAVPQTSSVRPVNVTTYDDYLRGVVPNEMPASWSAAALRAQAVAARTYAAHESSGGTSEICDTTQCQVYDGLADYGLDGALRARYTDSRSDAAITATSRNIRTWEGAPAFTQFSASNGGWTVAGSRPYLVAKADPYDGAVPNSANTWRVTSTSVVSRLQSAYPSIGAFRSIEATRDGRGEWGGRMTSAVLTGSAGTRSVSASSLRDLLGLRTTWFTVRNPDLLRRDVDLQGAPGRRVAALGRQAAAPEPHRVDPVRGEGPRWWVVGDDRSRGRR